MYRFSVFLKNGEIPCDNITNIELKDGYFGEELWELAPDKLEDIRNFLIEKLWRIVLYTVKTPLCEREKYIRIFRHAALLQIENIKICLCTLEGGNPERILELREIIKIAEAFQVRVLFEGGGKYAFFDIDRYRSVRSEGTGIIFNPLHYVLERKNPFLGVLYKHKLRDDIRILRVNDGLYEGGVPVMPEEGNAEIKECASALLARGFDGYFSFKEYLPNVPISEVIARFQKTLTEM